MGKFEQKLNYYLYRNPSILNTVINANLTNLELEFSFRFNDVSIRKVDILSQNLATKEIVFIETQLTEADEKHYKEFEKILNILSSESVVFIWIAKSFSELWMKKLNEKIFSEDLNITVYYIEISNRAIAEVYKLSSLDSNVLHEFETIVKLSIEDFFIAGEFKNRFSRLEVGCLKKELFHREHNNSKVLSKILSKMRKQSDFLSLHYYKDLSKHRMSFGLGKDQLTAYMGINLHRNTIYFSVAIPNEDYIFFDSDAELKSIIMDDLNHLVQFDKRNCRWLFEITNDENSKKYLFEHFACSAVKLIQHIYSFNKHLERNKSYLQELTD